MADEIKISLNVRVNNGNFDFTFPPFSGSFDQTSLGAWGQVIELTTSEEDVSIGSDIGTNGFVLIQNVGAAGQGDVRFGPKTGGVMVAFSDLEVGDPPALFRARTEGTYTLRCKAQGGDSTATMYVVVFEY